MSDLDEKNFDEESYQHVDGDDGNEEDYGSESEYEEVNITENPLYQVLSVFFEDDNGRNLCDKLDDLREAINRNTQVQSSILKQLSSSSSSSNSDRNRQRSQQKKDVSNRKK